MKVSAAIVAVPGIVQNAKCPFEPAAAVAAAAGAGGSVEDKGSAGAAPGVVLKDMFDDLNTASVDDIDEDDYVDLANEVEKFLEDTGRG